MLGAPKAEAAPASPAETVPCYVAYEGRDPRFLETRRYTVVDAAMDAHAEAEAAGLGREATIEHMASVLRGVGPKSKQRVGAGGGAGGGPWGGRGRVRGGAEHLGRGGSKGYLTES